MGGAGALVLRAWHCGGPSGAGVWHHGGPRGWAPGNCRGARGAEGLAGAPWAAQGLSAGSAGRAGPAVQGRRVSGGRCARGCAGRAAGLR